MCETIEMTKPCKMKEKNRERQISTVNDCRDTGDTAGDAETCSNTPEFPP
jgi:hypothetical protein